MFNLTIQFRLGQEYGRCTQFQHEVQLEFWDLLLTLEFEIEGEGCYKTRAGGSEKQVKVDERGLQ